jgi:hypothetical protein
MLLITLALFTTLATHGQEFRATLSGQVTDPSGAMVVDATITAVNVDSGTSYTARTTKEGTYYIPYVLPGTYTVTATANGFKTAIQDKVRLFAAQGFGQNFKLEVGGAAEQVEVTSAPPELETTTGSGGQLMLERELQSVPLNGRSVYSLIGTTPGSQSLSQSGAGTNSWYSSNNYSIGGGAVAGDASGSFNQFTLNGVNITQQTGFQNQNAGAWDVSPNLDTVDEVNVMTTNYDARFGRTAGGTINIVSKGGGNKFHGNLLEMYGGAIMEANYFQNKLYGLPRQGYVDNHYDGTFGGPIKKDKLFFFFGFEGLNNSTMEGVSTHLPPAYLRPGYNGNTGVDFGLAAILDSDHFGSGPTSGEPAGMPVYQPGTAACPISEGNSAETCSQNNDLYQTPYPGYSADGTTYGNIPGNQINSTAAAILKYIPLPNIKNATNFAAAANYYLPAPNTMHYYQPSIRVDYNLSDKTKLYSYYEWQTGTQNQINNGLTGPAANGQIGYAKENWAATQDVTHTFSPTLLLDAKASFSRFVVVNPNGNLSAAQSPSSLGLSMPLPGITTTAKLPEFTVSDNYTGGILGNNSANDNTIFGNAVGSDATTSVQFDADFTWTKGAHNFHIGGSFADLRFGDDSLSGHPNGDFNFGSNFTQYNPTNSGCWGTVPGSTGNKCDGDRSNPGNNPNQGNGSSLADFYLGYPGNGGIDWNGTNAESEPTYALYFQDDWRVNSKLTLNLGLRYDVERGMRDKHNALDAGMCLTCVNPVTSDANFAANIASASNIAGWKAAGITVPTQVLGGQLFPGVNGQSPDAYYTDWTNIGPRVGFAYAIDSKTVVRGGWGLVYQGGLEGGSNAGFAETTSYNPTPNGGISPTNSFNSGAPFGGVTLVVPPGSSQGLLSNVGNGAQAFDFPQRKLPRGEVFSLGFQRELPGRVVVDARYAGNYSYKNRVFSWINSSSSLASWKAAIANPNLWTAQVPNPYYNVSSMLQGGSGCGTSSTVWALDVIAPLGQYCGGGGSPALVGQYNQPIGKNWYNGLEVKVNRHVYGDNRGLFVQVAYTWSKTINGMNYGFGWPFQGSAAPVAGGISTGLAHIISGTDRDQVLAITPVWDIPVGKGSQFLSNPSKPVGLFINGWTLSSVISVQSGWPVGLNQGWNDSCSLNSLRPSHGAGKGEWLTNDKATINNCWSKVPNVQGYTWGLQTTPTQFTGVRQPTVPNFDISLMKSTPIREGMDFILRLDAFNSFNSPQFGGPDNNPGDGPPNYVPGSGWLGFGTIGPAQQNSPRIMKVSGKITF